ncbi:MAG: hypothetical protein ABSA78_02610 [Candidatus Sulfotelmatobacter sp.]|jgi:hypothetical protein
MPIEAPKKKRTLLPLLTVLFLFSYGLMTVLIVEQGSAIQAQRNLIKVLMRDSTELWAIKGKAISDKQTAQAQAQGRAHAPSAQNPSSQNPSTQAPQSHSSSHAGRVAKPESQVPPMPASDLTDQRRSLRTL